MTRPRKLVKMRGPTTWPEKSDAERGQIARAILHEQKKLVIELECEGYSYSVKLERRIGELFEGSWTCLVGNRTFTGPASARLYRSQSGDFLFGDWSEVGSTYFWWAELSIVENLPNESRRSLATR